MVDLYREPSEWKTVLEPSDGKSVIWNCGVVVSHAFHDQNQLFIMNLKSVAFATTEFLH